MVALMEASFPNVQELDLAELAEKPEWKTMLIEIVSQESLDPWDIDIAILTNRFVDRIKKRRRPNLRISANVVLAASILLRYKSDSWVLKEEEKDDVFFIPDEIYAEPVFPELRPVQRTTRRKVSLQELISAVEDIMKREKRRAARRIIPPIDLPPSLVAMMDDNGESFESRLDRLWIQPGLRFFHSSLTSVTLRK
jgi:alpha-N-acetylglucosamine transferase